MPIELHGVTKEFRAGRGDPLVAVDGVDLAVPDGQVVAITGPSGSGKSTLLHLVGGLERPTAGRVLVDDLDVGRLTGAALARHRRRVGFVFQRYNLIPTLNALDNVITPVLPFREVRDKRGRALRLLEAVGLGDRAMSLPARLSGGEQQRVAIARALMPEPALVLADEPTGSLDSRTGAEVLALVRGLAAERGLTVLIATHDPLVAAGADRVVRLRDGRVVDDQVLPEPADPAETLARVAGPQ